MELTGGCMKSSKKGFKKTSKKVSDIGEKDLVNYILSKSNSIIPDDAAILDFKNTKLISTTDMLIQTKHFPDEMTHYQMGFKAVTVNVSDIAAMGAKPLGFLLSIALPKSLPYADFKEIIKGVMDGCEFYKIPLIGGDLNEASEIIISATALGECKKPIMKDGYSEGDLVCLTGKIGLAALGFISDDYKDYALNPRARLSEALKLKDFATSMTDITDGLSSELYTIKKDDYGFMIYEDKLKITDEFKANAGEDYLEYVLYVGEDFELLFTVSKDDLDDLPINCMVIGEVTRTGKVEITLTDSKVCEIEKRGYEHYVS